MSSRSGAGDGERGLGKAVAFLSIVVVSLALASCSSGPRYRTVPGTGDGSEMVGLASWYGPGFHGRQTSSGEVFDMNDLTAAHKSIPFGTYVMVTNLDNDRTAVVRINDRGPFVKDRIIDLSYASARVLGIVGPGVVRVRLDIIGAALPPGVESSPPPSSWFVQVGAFTVQESAYKVKRRLEPDFQDVAVSTFRTESAVYYRVRIKASTRDEAAARARSLAAAGWQVIIGSD